ncbi:YdcF family protein [Nocardia terpenica]|uniref:YdcF family protein n=1 Tax=Nocardia terpenica TaxID=455432 RepID=UPI00189506E6|nr:YdcF family protein [Nocardia terpenica]MBF6064529.1 YdcF family protein [Nocardia terpenica]MBF6106847.1 YdcF family protein [Nocardia terpenica]MBF6114497.1 YdcF family protein [Nocardia terpenica]MBF6121417.1 YdcF family protein [Nocardia terpenica]MBF6153832.1 YdcF family protein [Nocardia terpenica]
MFRPARPTTATRRLLRTVLVAAAATAVFTGSVAAHADPPPPDPVRAFLDRLPPIADPTSFQLPGLPLIAGLGPDTAIVVLGYGLQPDGGMRPELINRLSAGYVQALLSPAAPIIVTGGNPENGVTEARAMAEWLVGHGIAPRRVHIEDRACSTVQNAEFSAQMMNTIGAGNAVLVTSTDHMNRAEGDFIAAGIKVLATLTPDQAPPSALPFGPN